MIILAISLFLFLVLGVLGVTSGIVLNLRERLAGCGRLQWSVMMVLIVLLAVFLFRPHEDTFAGLDNSGYRLMARAFQAGHPMHGVDTLLVDVPREIRNRFMLLPTMDERNTRDRSFLVQSLDKCKTEPFFYPLLPLCAMGFDAIMPGDALDYLIPVLGLVFVAVCLVVGTAYGGLWGLLIAVVLLIGSPLPFWLLRGFYVESAASVLLALALLCWITCPEDGRVSRFAYLALGLAVSFHPAMVVVSLPLLMVIVLSPEERLRNIFAGLIFFGAGFAVMIGMFTYACSPYGDLSFSSLEYHFIVSASHRITIMCGGVIVVVASVAVLTKSVWFNWYSRLSGSRRYIVTCLSVVFSAVPILLAATIWSQKEFVCRGLVEAGSGIRLWLGIFLAVSTTHIIFSRQNIRLKLALAVVLLALPVFTYLKGAEQMGLWSQRRLLPVYLLTIAFILPASAERIRSMIQKTSKPVNFIMGGATVLFLLMAGGSNPYRWPAPYVVRCDKGTWVWVEKIRAKIGDRLVFFDYYPYSVPFAVTGETRALGLCEKTPDGVAELAWWLAEKARKEEVLVATAYENPGEIGRAHV